MLFQIPKTLISKPRQLFQVPGDINTLCPAAKQVGMLSGHTRHHFIYTNLKFAMENKFILLDEDHKLLTKALETDTQFALLSDAEKNSIKNRLANAQQVTTSDFPNNVSRLYDVITLRNIRLRQNIQYKIVPPGERDEWKGKISAISPLGILLMGAVNGQAIVLQTSKKKKHYVVMEVRNAMYI
ncbi:MAG: GreA/GreB family elongation factor [Chitinophagaceae bacterium]|nr:GreA/GreB family elongation factor [Chitinophagaceae bacterium]